jgi:hypothetical protein
MDQKYSIIVSETPTVLINDTLHIYVDTNLLHQEYKGNRTKSYDTHLSVGFIKKRSMSS